MTQEHAADDIRERKCDVWQSFSKLPLMGKHRVRATVEHVLLEIKERMPLPEVDAVIADANILLEKARECVPQIFENPQVALHIQQTVDRIRLHVAAIVKEQEERCTADAEWMRAQLLPGIRRLAESSLEDFSGLEEAFKFMQPKNVAESTLQETKRIGVGIDTRSSQQKRLMKIIKLLNEKICMPLGLFITRNPSSFTFSADDRSNAADRLWKAISPQLTKIMNIKSYRFRDHIVHALIVRCIKNETRLPPLHFDGTQGYVVLSPETIAHLVLIMEQLAKTEELSLASASSAGMTDAEIEEFKRHALRIAKTRGSTKEIFDAEWARTVAEEIRHGIDHLRSQAKVVNENYYENFAETILSHKGILRKVWKSLHNLDDRILFARVFSELSARMTAAGASIDHRVMLSEWHMDVAIVEREPENMRLWHHRHAATIAMLLLGQELGLTPPVRVKPMPALRDLLNFCLASIKGKFPQQCIREPNLRVVCMLAEAMEKMPAEKIRLALKKIYAREFSEGEIDEYPFPQILEDGTLKKRPPKG